jgi:hypothetical protein
MTDTARHAAIPLHRLLLGPITVRRALKISAIIGTLLVLINQGDMLLAGQMPPLWKIILTYLVPYGVSSYSTAALLYETSRAGG